MSLTVCPIAQIQAPVEQAWALLADPALYSAWFDAETVTIEPAGQAQPGQVIRAADHTFGKRWEVKDFDFPPGCRGWLIEKLGGRFLEKEVENSLGRLKRTAAQSGS